MLETEGLLDEAPHAQHVHIGGTNTCPGPDVEGTGPHGELQTSDGIPSYGDVALSLTIEPGMTSGDHALDVENFPATGSYTYERTIEVDDETATEIAEGNGVLVVHGVDHDGSGTYDGDATSDLDPALPAEATNPALCGEFEVAQMAMPEDGVATGGADTAGTEHVGLIALGGVTLAVAGLVWPSPVVARISATEDERDLTARRPRTTPGVRGPRAAPRPRREPALVGPGSPGR